MIRSYFLDDFFLMFNHGSGEAGRGWEDFLVTSSLKVPSREPRPREVADPRKDPPVATKEKAGAMWQGHV